MIAGISGKPRCILERENFLGLIGEEALEIGKHLCDQLRRIYQSTELVQLVTTGGPAGPPLFDRAHKRLDSAATPRAGSLGVRSGRCSAALSRRLRMFRGATAASQDLRVEPGVAQHLAG